MNAQEFNEKHGHGRIPAMVCARLAVPIDGADRVRFGTYLLESRMVDAGDGRSMSIEVYYERGGSGGWFPLLSDSSPAAPAAPYILVM